MAWLWTAAVAEVLLEQLSGGVRVHFGVLSEYIFKGFTTRLKGI